MEIPTDVLSLARVKQELEIPADADDQNDYLTSLVAASVAAVEQHTGLPLVQARERYVVTPDRPDEPVRVWASEIQQIYDLRWHEAGQTLAQVPTGCISSPDCRFDRLGDGVRIWPPADTGQWPDLINCGVLWFDLIRQSNPTPDVAVTAAVIALRKMYDGENFQPVGAFLNLLSALGVGARGDLPAENLADTIPYVPLSGETPPDRLPDGVVTLRGDAVTLRSR